MLMAIPIFGFTSIQQFKMKKLLIFLSVFISFLSSYGQTQPPFQTIGNIGNEVKINGIGSAYKGFALRNNYADTTAMNLDAYLKNIGGIQARSGDTIWQRSNDLTRWFKAGGAGSVYTDTSSTFRPFGNGSDGYPLGGDVVISQQEGNSVQSLSDGIFVPSGLDGVSSGGLVTWVSGYTYDVSYVQFPINGVQYTADGDQVTLPNSDPTLDRIDVIVAQTDGTIDFVEGTPSTNPQQPSVDVTTQWPLAFILVTAGSTQPTINQEWIYLNNAEWTTTSSTARINPASTNNPYSPTLDIEGTAVQNGDNLRFDAPTPPVDMTQYNILTMKLRSKAVWANTSRINFQFYNAATPIGTAVSVANNSFGFQSSNTTDYQTVSIALSSFGSLSNVTALVMTISTVSGQTIGFYLDDIQMQMSDIPTVGRKWSQGGDSFGELGTFGTNDNQSIAFRSNNTERMRLLSTGGLLIGGTAYTSALSKLEIYGNTFIGGTSPKVRVDQLLEFDGSNSAGKFLFTSIGGNQGFEIRKSSNNGHMLALRNTATDADYLYFGAKTTLSLSGTNVFPSTQGVAGYYVGYNVINTTSSWGSGITTKNHYMDFYPNVTGTSTSLMKMEAISSDLSLLAESKEIQYVTMSARFLSPNADHRIVIGSASDDGSTSLQTTGSQKFAGLSTDNTATQVLAKDGSGLNVWRDASTLGGTITADNGLTMSTATNAQLGSATQGDANSPLLHTTYINTTSSYQFIASGSNATGTFRGLNTSGGYGVEGVSSSGTAVAGNSTSGVGGGFSSVSTYALSSISTSTSTASAYIQLNNSTTAVGSVARLVRLTSGVVADGLGGSLDFYIERDNGGGSGVETLSNQIISTFTTVASATRVSQLRITGVNNAVTGDILTLNGNKSIQFNGYGAGSIGGTGTYGLAVDASGNVIEIALGGAGFTNPMGAIGDLITSSDGAGTPVAISPGTAGFVLTSNGAGSQPTWEAAPGTGTVTDVSWVGGIVSIATSTTTPAFTIAGTSGGVPYFSSSSTWASSAALAANAIVIGGGAGVAPSTTTTGTGILTFLGTPSSANLISAVTDETGTGALVFANTPTLVAPILGTPTSVTLTNATGLPLTTGVTGTLDETNGGTGIASYATGDVIYATGVNTLGKLTATTDGFVLTLSGGVPVWSAAGAGTITAVNGTTNQVNANTVGTVVTLSTPQDIHTSAGPQFNNINLGGTSTANTIGLFVGTTTLTNSGIYNSPIITPAAGASAQVYYSDGDIIEASSGTHSSLMGANFVPPIVTGGAASVTNTATVYVGGAMSATVTGANYALWVNGSTRFDILGGTGSRYVQADANGVVSATYTIFNPTVQTLTDGATITWNASNGGNGAVTLNGTGRTLTITNPTAGHTYTIEITQGSGGSKTITTWPTGTTWSGSNTLSTTAGDVDVVVLYYNGTGYRAQLSTDYQ